MIELASIAILAAGIWLLKRGRWPVRVGDTRHCPDCNYILTGIQADRCPECGADISPGKIIHGERHRRPAMTLLGLLLIGLPVVVVAVHLTGALRDVNWYRYRPAAWVIKDLDSPSRATRDKAWTELQRRLADNSLAVAQQDALIDRALREQQPNGAGSYRTEMVDFLGQYYREHKLSDAQAARFLENVMKMRLDVPPVVGPGDPIPFRRAAVGRAPFMGWGLQVKEVGLWVDGMRIEPNRVTVGDWLMKGPVNGWVNSALEPQIPGTHRLRVAVEARVLSNFSRENNGTLERTRTMQLTADFQVSREEPPVAWLNSPSTAVMRGSISADHFWHHRLGVGGPVDAESTVLEGTIRVTNSPVDLAFEIFARTNGNEIPLGTISFRQSAGGIPDWGGYSAYKDKLPGDLHSIDIILRSSERVARQSVEMAPVWRGEIVLAKVPVKESK